MAAAQAAAETTRLETICEQVLAGVGDRADAQVTASVIRTGLTRFANSGIHQHVGEHVVTATLTVAVEGRVASVETSRTDDAGLYDLVEHAFAAASIQHVDPDWPGVAPPTDIPEGVHDDVATHEALPADRAVLVERFVAAGETLRAAGYVDTEGVRTVLTTSAGHRAVGSMSRATVDGIHQTATSAGKGHQTSHRLADLDAAAVGERAARLARDSADAADIEPGRIEVVLAPECVATIMVFLGFYGFNAKSHLEGQSFAELGEQQFDPALDVWDDATDSRAIGLLFDAEGTPKQPVGLITRGRTSSLCHDRRTAKRAGAATTGHAIPGGAVYGACPTNLFVSPGDAADIGELVSQVDRGLLVTEFNYCRVLDPRTQVVTGLTRNGTFQIEDGEVVRPVTNLRFTQSFIEALAPGNLLGATRRARFSDSEFGAGMVHAPAMRLAGWTFTGGARG